jgi:hypothetical protein
MPGDFSETWYDPRWDSLSNDIWDAFACAWLAELAGRPPISLPALPVLFEDEPEEISARAYLVQMNFTASAEAQWKFIISVFMRADDDALCHLAAGPVEHLLSNHGEEYIGQIESMAEKNSRFTMMLKLCHKHLMSDKIWNRVCAVCNK